MHVASLGLTRKEWTRKWKLPSSCGLYSSHFSHVGNRVSGFKGLGFRVSDLGLRV